MTSKAKSVGKKNAGTKASQKKAKVIWAYDPFAKPLVSETEWARFLENLSQIEKTPIEPVYVLSPDGFNFTGEFSGAWTKKYLPLAEIAAQKNLAHYRRVNFTPFKILVNREASLRGDVVLLSRHAKREKAEFIVTQTHAREGMERWFFGSFVETLMLHSNVPVLCVNPLLKPPTHFKRVLFPTDLSAESKRSFKWLLKRLSKWQCEVTLFYKLPDIIEPVVQSGVFMAGGGWVSVSDYFKREGEGAHKELEGWAALASEAKVKADFQIVDQPGLTADAIIAAASRDVDLIAMSSHAGPVSSVLMGSIARQLVRKAPCPVLVFHTKGK